MNPHIKVVVSSVGKLRYERIGILSKFTEKKARRKVAEFQSLVDQGMNPNSITKKKSKDTKTFKDAADDWFNYINNEKHLTPVTISNYKKQLYNQALPFIGGTTLLRDLQWRDDTDGREIVMNMIKHGKRKNWRTSKKDLGVCRQVFDYAIDNGWMSHVATLHTSQKMETRKVTTQQLNGRKCHNLYKISTQLCDGTYEVQTVASYDVTLRAET